MIAKKYRLRKWRVEKILKKGIQKNIGNFIVKIIPNNECFHRWSLVVSRKFSRLATKRNRTRRQIYEAIRNCTQDKEEKIDKYHDVVLIPKKTLIQCSYHTIYKNISDILEYLKSKSI